MLSDDQKRFYEENGYLKVEGAVSPDELAALRAATRDLIEASRSVAAGNDIYEIEDGHSPDSPRLRRIKLPHKRHKVFRDMLFASRITEVLTDLLGPDTMLQTSKLNTKAPGGGQAVEWHQDWAFYPHTNDSMLAFGVLLDDVTAENGPLQVIPGSHRGPVLSHHANGVFCGAIDPGDPDFHPEQAVTLTGRAGDMTVHHARTLHGSAPNRSDRARMMLFYECHAADAWPLLGQGNYIHSQGQQAIWDDLHARRITGDICLTPRVAPAPVRIPLPPAPDASSIFRSQKSGGARSAFG